MASVSIAARDSFRVTTDSCVKSHARSLAVRSVHLPPTRTRLTPRGAYSFCNCVSSARTSAPAGRRPASAFSSSGASAANSRASRMRSSSARLGSTRSCFSLSPTITRIFATFDIGFFSLLPIPRFRGPAVVRPLTQIKRRKRPLLVRLHPSFAYQFERRGKTRGEHGRSHRRIDQIGDEVLIERAPVHRLADQPFQRLARFGERPDRALGHAHKRPCLGLPPPGIGREQVVDRCRPLRVPDLGDRLWLSAVKYVTAELRAIEQLLGNLPDRFQPPQAV